MVDDAVVGEQDPASDQRDEQSHQAAQGGACEHVAAAVVVVAHAAQHRHPGGYEARHLDQGLHVAESESGEPGLQINDREEHGVPGKA